MCHLTNIKIETTENSETEFKMKVFCILSKHAYIINEFVVNNTLSACNMKKRNGKKII